MRFSQPFREPLFALAQMTAAAPRRVYFDLLPNVALEAIVRFLSTRPRVPEWRRYVAIKDALAVLRCRGTLGTAAQVLDGGYGLEVSESAWGCLKDRRPAPASRAIREPPTTRTLLSTFGLRLARLRVCVARLPQWYEYAVALNAARLRHLVLCVHIKTTICSANFGGADIAALVALRGAALESLTIDVPVLDRATVAAIAAWCRSLRRLGLPCTGAVPCSLAPVWQAAGGRLEEVELMCPRNADMLDLAGMRAACRCVSALRLYGFWEDDTCRLLEDTCRAYGPQLQALTLDCPVETLRRILPDCPNAVVELRRTIHTPDEAAAGQLVALGPRASTLLVDAGMEGEDGLEANLAAVGSACPNLQSVILELDVLPDKAIHALFAHPKLMLTRFTCDFQGPNADALFEALAEKSSSLETFEYSGPSPPIPLLQRLLGANKHLRRVRFTTTGFCICSPTDRIFNEADASADIHWSSFLAVFLEAATLEQLECSCSHGAGCRRLDVLEALLHVRYRDIAVSVCGFQYL